MSYILDALRRADAERQRGDVPGLHAQPGTGAARSPDAEPAASAGWAGWAGKPQILALLGGLVVTAAVLIGWLGRGPGAVPSATMAPAPAPVQAPMQAAQQAPIPVPIPVPLPAPVQVATPAPITVIVPVPMAAPVPLAVAPAPPPAAAASDAVLPLASLSEATRRSLPALAWSGVVFADRAEQRLVVVNGQVAREGDEIAAGLQLLQIRAKSVVLRWRGQRIEMPV